LRRAKYRLFLIAMKKHATLFQWLAIFLVGAFVDASAQSADSVRLLLDRDNLIFPGNSVSIGLEVMAKNGSISRTRGLLEGRIAWRKFYIESSIDPRIRNGVIRIPRDFSLLNKRVFTVRVYDRKKKRLFYEDTIPYHYPTQIKPRLPASFVKAPGFKTPFWLDVQWNDGTTTQIKNKKGGLLSLANFIYKVEGGEVSRNRLCISPDVHAFSDHRVAMYAYARDFTVPESDVVSFMLDYKASYNVTRSAWNGSSGSNGFSGSDGSAGCRGSDGGWGAPGGHGEHGHDLKVTMDAYFDDILQTTLVDVWLTDLVTDTRHQYRVDAQEGRVVVRSSGGDGGSGGRGGDGGDGGAGIDGRTEKVTRKVNDSTSVEETIRYPGSPGGDGGNGGHGGPGGYGGDGGNIYVHYTKAAAPYLNVLEAVSRGGSGGSGGFGGSSGDGGRGGSGEPSGRSGCSGRSGSSAPSGGDGRPGRVLFYLADR